MKLKEVVIQDKDLYESCFGRWIDASEYLPNNALSSSFFLPYLVWVQGGHVELGFWDETEKTFWIMDGDPANDVPLEVLFWQPIKLPEGCIWMDGMFSDYDVFIRKFCHQRDIVKGAADINGKAVN